MRESNPRDGELRALRERQPHNSALDNFATRPAGNVILDHCAFQAPYCLFVEVLEVDDLHKTPVAPKLSEAVISALRHSKSEEQLGGEDGGRSSSPPPMPSVHFTLIQPSMSAEFPDDAWSQEDDEFSCRVSF